MTFFDKLFLLIILNKLLVNKIAKKNFINFYTGYQPVVKFILSYMENFFVLLCSILSLLGFAQLDYPNYDDLLSKLKQLKENKYVTISTIVKAFPSKYYCR